MRRGNQTFITQMVAINIILVESTLEGCDPDGSEIGAKAKKCLTSPDRT